MRTRKISLMSYGVRFLLPLFVLAGSIIILPASRLAYAHTFSTSESAQFLSLVDQIRAETRLVTMNLENNNATLAQAHAQQASSLLDNSTIREIRERNTRIAVTLDSGLTQLKENVTSLASASQGQIPQDKIQSINQAVVSLNDTLAEAVSIRIEPDQQNNATTWAMALGDLVNVVLSDYGKATGAAFDLTNMSNLAGVGGNSSSSSSSNNNTMTMSANASSSMSNITTTTIVDKAAYQSAQYLANNTILQLFNDMLKPLTVGLNQTSGNNATNMVQQAQDGLTAVNNTTSNIQQLEAGLLQLKDDINSKATPNVVMTTAHLKIHPLLIKIYGLSTGQQEGQEDSQLAMGQ
jgi:hypothetical protein